MTCRRARGLLSAVLDGELAARPRGALLAHLAECQECRKELAALRTAADLLADFRAPRLAADLAPGVVARAARPPWAVRARGLGGALALRPAFIVRQVGRAAALLAICALAAGSGDRCSRLILAWPERVAAVAQAGAARLAAGLVRAEAVLQEQAP